MAMKHSILLILTVGVALSGGLHAIPQTVGGLFTTAPNNPGNLTLEEWFRDAAHWEAGTKVPGVWVAGTVSTGMMMSNPGAIFGVNASQVVVNRDDKGAIESVQVFYDADTAKIAKGDLHKRLSKAVALFTGADGKAAGYTVTLADPNAGAVTATLKR
jgi:hypothetical protein